MHVGRYTVFMKIKKRIEEKKINVVARKRGARSSGESFEKLCERNYDDGGGGEW